ncbi:hypothetical protein CDAR_423911 [Caerostris darwini]|uniref:Uncharacterized protein n=1 Tax=Caerostris darwini TaxID=1538125 RepID=A0AAV4VDM0_9ARAC|nr:hypothetical protein CDAR_423911 [Caerostris darwini]
MESNAGDTTTHTHQSTLHNFSVPFFHATFFIIACCYSVPLYFVRSGTYLHDRVTRQPLITLSRVNGGNKNKNQSVIICFEVMTSGSCVWQKRRTCRLVVINTGITISCWLEFATVLYIMFDQRDTEAGGLVIKKGHGNKRRGCDIHYINDFFGKLHIGDQFP